MNTYKFDNGFLVTGPLEESHFFNRRNEASNNFESSLTKKCLLKSKQSMANPKNPRRIVKGRPERQKSAIIGKKSIMSSYDQTKNSSKYKSKILITKLSDGKVSAKNNGCLITEVLAKMHENGEY